MFQQQYIEDVEISNLFHTVIEHEKLDTDV